MRSDDVTASTGAFMSASHPHEPEIPPAWNEDGRCLVCGLGVLIDELLARKEILRNALEDIAAPRRPDGTYNLSRAACEEMATDALVREEDFTNRPLPRRGFSPYQGKAPRRWSARGRDMTGVSAMQENRNDLHLRVSYATDCPEWWRIQVRRRLGRVGLATRAECVEWLRSYGTSEDDNLALEYERWQEAAEQGVEVRWYDEVRDGA